ncbi:site-specific DNA-methyltransferase [Pseudomonas sp. FYR_11]|uniref:site-specific DNA-methyltransferase n=1 Tax=Pseudomonas TaxID=286 RepID=UPI00370CA754
MNLQKIDAQSPEAQSADLKAGNIAKLKTLFPELITEGPNGVAINQDVLRQLIGEATVTDTDEKYGLNWHGKRAARQLALTPSTGTLLPCPDESMDWDTTQNLMIEGDNLEVLKLLQKSYAGKVKLIYIDPPYNTGQDFVYPDNFQDSIKNYLELTGQIDGGARISSNTESSGRFHTDWMNMLYPRLKLARNLLRDDGLIFVSIDDTEAGNLKLIMSEVFGEENFIGNAVWEKAYTANMTAQFMSNTHDHIFIFAKDCDFAALGRFDRTEDQIAKFKNPDNDPRGPWKAENLSAGKFYAAGQFKITGPTSQEFLPPPGRYWRCNQQQYETWLADNRITFGMSGEGRPMLKKFLSEVADGLTPSTWWNHNEFGTNKEASLELKQLFDGEACFQTPKPEKLLRKICALASSGDEIILDFFGGSGTTGHAVLAQNSIDGGNRRYILVQLPEALDPEHKDQKAAAALCNTLGVKQNIAELTKERLRRAANKIKADNPMFSGDTGFRNFKLDTSNIRAWNPTPEDLTADLLAHQEHLIEGRSEYDILYELLLKLGLDLCVPIEQQQIAEETVYSIGGGVLLACLTEQITRDQVEELAQGIVAWHKALAPASDSTCVFRDSAFADDIAKTNLAAILNQAGIKNVRSL